MCPRSKPAHCRWWCECAPIVSNQLKRHCNWILVAFNHMLLSSLSLVAVDPRCSMVDFSFSALLSSKSNALHFSGSTAQHRAPAGSMKFVGTLFAYLLIATFDIVVRPKRTRSRDSLRYRPGFSAVRFTELSFMRSARDRPKLSTNFHYIVFV